MNRLTSNLDVCFLLACSDGKGTRSAASRFTPSVSYPRTLCNEEGPQFHSYRVQLNGNEKPASASLDRLLEELSTVTVANSSVPDKSVVVETTDNELLSPMACGVDSEEKLSPNSFHERKASLPDLNENLVGVESLAVPEVYILRPYQTAAKNLSRLPFEAEIK